MLAFEGIESLMHGGMGGFGFGGGMPVEETVVNNYYDAPQDQGAMQNDPGQYDNNGADLASDQGYGDEQNFDSQNFDDQNFGDQSFDGGDFGGDDSSLV
jgi:hypothetical protein